MRRPAVLGLLGLVACGRLGFDAPLADGDPDATSPALGRCGVGTTAPDPIAISGTVLYATSFTGSNEEIADATLTIGTPSGTLLASATSDADGAYTFPAVPTGGVAAPLVTTVTKPGYFQTLAYRDLAFDRTTSGIATQIIDDAALSAVYGHDTVGSGNGSGVPYDPSLGSIGMQAVDCAGDPLDDVSFGVSPPPGAFTYYGSDGEAVGSGMLGSDSIATAFRQPVGSADIQVFYQGALQLELDGVRVDGGSSLTTVTVHVAR